MEVKVDANSFATPSTMDAPPTNIIVTKSSPSWLDHVGPMTTKISERESNWHCKDQHGIFKVCFIQPGCLNGLNISL